MKKTLIALALTALPVASMADVILYGQIKAGVEVVKEKRGNKSVDGTTTQIVDYGSRIGFKGHEHLNGDLQAIWQLEQKVDVGGSSNRGFGTRDSFIGLKGNFGTVKAGYQETPVTELNGNLDIWEYSASEAGLGWFTRDNDASGRRVAVSYETPDFSGFSAKAYYSPSEQYTGETTGSRNRTGKPLFGLSASYKHNAGFFADLAGVYVKNGDTAAYHNKKGGYQALAQAGFENDKFLAGVAYQHAYYVDGQDVIGKGTQEGTYTAEAVKGQEVAVSVAYNATPALRLKASGVYGFNWKDGNGDKVRENGKYSQGIVGADYALSKRTQLNGQVGYMQYGRGNDENKGRQRVGVASFGLKHKF